MGHRDLLVTQTYLSSKATTAPFVPREASAAGWLRSNAVTGKVGTGSNLSDRVRRLGLGAFDLGRRLSS
jgi:hypothetical protein